MTTSSSSISTSTSLPIKITFILILSLLSTNKHNLLTSSYCIGYLRNKDIAGIWRLTRTQSFLPTTVQSISSSTAGPNAASTFTTGQQYPMKEFTVYPKKKKQQTVGKNNKVEKDDIVSSIEEDILLLLKEDGEFVQYFSSPSSLSSSYTRTYPKSDNNDKQSSHQDSNSNNNNIAQSTYAVAEMKGSWALVDGKLILATDRRNDITNIRSEGFEHDTILEGEIVAVSDESLVENPPIVIDEKEQNGSGSGGGGGEYNILNSSSKNDQENNNNNSKESTSSQQQQHQQQHNNINTHRTNSSSTSPPKKEDVHLSVPKGKVKIGKFFYPKNHPSFFETPIFRPTSTGSFELRQVLGHLNTQIKGGDDDERLIEMFRKKDLMDKRYFITSYPLPAVKKKRQRWSIKYNRFVDAKPKSAEEKAWEERQKDAPIPIKTFEVDLFANNTFQTVTGLGDTILRGKWSIIGEKRDQLWMKVWRFGFGRSVSGSTFSEGASLSNKDDVAYWGKIYQVDTAESKDDNGDGKSKKIEINGSVMYGVGIEPTSVAQFTMIEKSEEDYFADEDDDDDDNDDDDDDNEDKNEEEDEDFFQQFDDIGTFE